MKNKKMTALFAVIIVISIFLTSCSSNDESFSANVEREKNVENTVVNNSNNDIIEIPSEISFPETSTANWDRVKKAPNGFTWTIKSTGKTISLGQSKEEIEKAFGSFSVINANRVELRVDESIISYFKGDTDPFDYEFNESYGYRIVMLYELDGTEVGYNRFGDEFGGISVRYNRFGDSTWFVAYRTEGIEIFGMTTGESSIDDVYDVLAETYGAESVRRAVTNSNPERYSIYFDSDGNPIEYIEGNYNNINSAEVKISVGTYDGTTFSNIYYYWLKDPTAHLPQELPDNGDDTFYVWFGKYNHIVAKAINPLHSIRFSGGRNGSGRIEEQFGTYYRYGEYQCSPSDNKEYEFRMDIRWDESGFSETWYGINSHDNFKLTLFEPGLDGDFWDEKGVYVIESYNRNWDYLFQ